VVTCTACQRPPGPTLHVQSLGTLRVKHMESRDLTRFNMRGMHMQKTAPAQPARSPSHPPGESLETTRKTHYHGRVTLPLAAASGEWYPEPAYEGTCKEFYCHPPRPVGQCRLRRICLRTEGRTSLHVPGHSPTLCQPKALRPRARPVSKPLAARDTNRPRRQLC